MREIKFRARYRITEKGFVYFSLDDLLHREGVMFPEDLAEIMQFTGLRDKNGTEVYEGDLIKDTVGDIREIKYVSNGFWLSYPNGGHYIPLEEFMEVVGNVYENPSLLQANNKSK